MLVGVVCKTETHWRHRRKWQDNINIYFREIEFKVIILVSVLEVKFIQ
jgi:hypothetical protein